MKNISLYVIVDNLFKFILLFLLNLIWCLYFIKNPRLAIFVSVFISIAIIFILNKFGKKKKNKQLLNLKTEQHMLDVKNTFVFMSNEELLTFFYKLTQSKHTSKIENNYIVIETTTLPIILYPIFKQSNLTCDDVVEFYKKNKTKKIKKLVILTNAHEPNIFSTTNNFDFETIVLDYKKTYLSLLKHYEFYPEIKVKPKQKAKTTFKQILALSLNKKKTKGYLLSALFIIFASLFVSYKIYYLVFSTVLIVLAFFSYFNPTFNLTSKTNLLD